MSAKAKQPEPNAGAKGSPKGSFLYNLAVFLLPYIFGFFFRLKVRGADNLPSEGGVLIASNHQSYLDPMIVGPSLARPVTFMARDTLFKNWFFGPLIRNVHAFPVKRGAADLDAIREAIKRLEAGWPLLVFPEGKRTEDGSVGRLHSGPAMLAHRANVPIMPTVIKGAFEAWPRTRKLPRFGHITITFGKPMPPPSGRADYEKVSEELQQRLESLMNDGA